MSEFATTQTFVSSTAKSVKPGSSVKRAIVKSAVGVVIGLTLLVFASLSVHSTSAVCAGQQMHPGDFCLMTNGSRLSYSKMLDKERHSALMFAVFGGVITLSSARAVVTAARRRQR